MFRKSCGACHFCNTKRPSDITLADFWGWQRVSEDFNKDDKGCSLVLVNTPKGRELFELIKDRVDIIECNLQDCMQSHLQHPSDIHPKSEEFKKDYVKHGFKYVLKKDYDHNIIQIVIIKLKILVKKIIRYK